MNLTYKTKTHSIHLKTHAVCLTSSPDCYIRVTIKLRRLIKHSPCNKINLLVQQLKYTFMPPVISQKKEQCNNGSIFWDAHGSGPQRDGGFDYGLVYGPTRFWLRFSECYLATSRCPIQSDPANNCLESFHCFSNYFWIATRYRS
jgi:hypothetical protein